jgi:DNA-binding transcriptional regulator LsrR (DeoR family)
MAFVADYQAGMTINDLADAYGIHRWTVMRQLDRLGVERRQLGLRPEHVQAAARLYNAGWSLAGVGDKFGVTASTVAKRLRQDGVKIRPRRGWHNL